MMRANLSRLIRALGAEKPPKQTKQTQTLTFDPRPYEIFTLNSQRNLYIRQSNMHKTFCST